MHNYMQAICEGDSSAVNFRRPGERKRENSQGLDEMRVGYSASVTQMNGVMSRLLAFLLSPTSVAEL